MANICITGVCNRACTYCFAGMNVSGSARAVPYMTWETYLQALDYAQRSQADHVRILGGEPTLHPEFAAMVSEALARNLMVKVFSNGLMPERAVEFLQAVPQGKVIVLLNVNLLPGSGLPDVNGQQRVLERLGPAITVGLNIAHPCQSQPYPLLDLIRQYKLAPTMRVGIAHPRIGGSNQALHPRYYATVGRRLGSFMAHAKGEGISVGLDCGFVPCMFPEEAREILKEQHFGASPCIPVLDILTTGELISCYPLEALGQVPLSATADAAALRTLFESKLSQVRQTTLFPDCVECREYLSHVCPGGCLAASLRRLRGASGQEVRAGDFPVVV
jgi:Radical SAM superfamily/4Fe-4S single cluster domain